MHRMVPVARRAPHNLVRGGPYFDEDGLSSGHRMAQALDGRLLTAGS